MSASLCCVHVLSPLIRSLKKIGPITPLPQQNLNFCSLFIIGSFSASCRAPTKTQPIHQTNWTFAKFISVSSKHINFEHRLHVVVVLNPLVDHFPPVPIRGLFWTPLVHKVRASVGLGERKKLYCLANASSRFIKFRVLPKVRFSKLFSGCGGRQRAQLYASITRNKSPLL